MISIEIILEEHKLLKTFSLMKYLYPRIESFSEKEYINFFKELSTHYNYEIAVLQNVEKVLGLIGYRSSKAFSFGNYIYVNDLVICLQERGKGYGTYLLDWIKEKAKKESKTIHLDVNKKNKAAVSFYKKNGLIFRATHGAWAYLR